MTDPGNQYHSMPPRISVVIPTYNTSEQDLLRSISSVLSQSYSSWELIVVDDGSKIPFAGLDKVLTDGRIHWVPLHRNRGVACARNVGIEDARGEYVAFLDAGDWWENEKLAMQINLFQSSEIGWVYCGAIGHIPDGRQVRKRPRLRGRAYRPLLRGDQSITGSCSAVVVKKSLLQRVGGFYEEEDLHEDWDLWIRLAAVAAVDYTPYALVHIPIWEDHSRSKQLEAFAQRKRTFLRRHEAELRAEGSLRHAWARHYLIMGQQFLMQGHALKAVANWSKVLSFEPRMFPIVWIPALILSIACRPLFRKIISWRLTRLQ